MSEGSHTRDRAVLCRRLPRPCAGGVRRAHRHRRRARPARAVARRPDLRPGGRARPGPGREARRARHRVRRPGRLRLAQQRPAASPRSSASPATAACWCRSTSGSPSRRCSYIVEHSGARVLYVDPELEDALEGRRVRAQVRPRRRRGHVRSRARSPSRGSPTRTPPRRSTTPPGTTARPKGVQITHRNIWTNAVTFALHTGVTDRDVYLHTLPMFHANGWGMPFAMTGMGVKQVVIRKIDGAEILRRVEKHGVTVMCAAPAVVAVRARRGRDLGGRDPGARQGAHHRRRCAAADQDRGPGRGRARLGVHPDLRPDRDLARC